MLYDVNQLPGRKRIRLRPTTEYANLLVASQFQNEKLRKILFEGDSVVGYRPEDSCLFVFR